MEQMRPTSATPSDAAHLQVFTDRVYWQLSVLLEFVLSVILLVDVSLTSPPMEMFIVAMLILLLFWAIASLVVTGVKAGFASGNLVLNLASHLFSYFSSDTSMAKLVVFLIIFNWLRHWGPSRHQVSLANTSFLYWYSSLTTLYLALFIGHLTDDHKSLL